MWRDGHQLSGKIEKHYTIYDLLFWCSMSFIIGLVVRSIQLGVTP